MAYGWTRIENDLYKALSHKEFFDQFDTTICEDTMNKNVKWSSSRHRIYNWFKQYIRNQSKSKLEKILTFITGTSRIPLTKKITVSLIFL